MKMRILVTGANGFIGRHVIAACHNSDIKAEIHAIRSPFGVPTDRASDKSIWHTIDLLDLDAVNRVLESVRPTHIIHAAWITTHGVYWTSAENKLWLEASIGLLDGFIRNGGYRFVQIGTCAEYEWSDGKLIEGITPEIPTSLYGQSKLAFHHVLLDRIKKNKVSAANGRVFYAYGPYENPSRLVPSACRALIAGNRIEFGCGSLWRDYMHVADLGTAIICLARSTMNGAVNLGTGEPVRLSMILELLGKISERPELLVLKEYSQDDSTPPILIADSRRIRSIGWTPSIDIIEGLTATYHWWKMQLAAQP